MAFVWLWALPIGLAALVFTLAVHYAHLHGMGHPRPHFHVLRKGHHHLGVALACSVCAGFIAGAAAATGYQILAGPHGLLEPPEPAQRARGMPGSGRRARGLLARPGRVGAPRTYSARPLPAAVDLSQWAPPVGDQGDLNSCVSWAVGYGLASYYAARAGHPIPRGGAPMFVYSLAARATNQGTTFPQAYQVVARSGVDSRAHYRQGDYNYWARPTLGERLHALRWRSGGYRTLFLGAHQGAYARAAIEGALAGGDPVTIGIPVSDNVLQAGPSSYFIDGAHGQTWGGHAVVGFKYDRNGLWVMSSWGTAWGLHGWVELGWGFIARDALEADVMTRGRHL